MTTTNNEQIIAVIEGLGSYKQKKVTLSEMEKGCKMYKNYYEVIPDDGFIKPYFDIDYKIQEGDVKSPEEYNEKCKKLLINRLLNLQEFYGINVPPNENEDEFLPTFCVATAHKENKFSFHINITNLNTTKQSMWETIRELNVFARKAEKEGPHFEPYLQFGEEDLFDQKPYQKTGKSQKMRCVHCVKDNEPNRPLKLLPKEVFDAILKEADFVKTYGMNDAVSGKFEDMLISVTNPANIVYAPIAENKPRQEQVSRPLSTNINKDEMLFDMAFERGLMTEYAKDYEKWLHIGFIIKNTFDDEKGWQIFDKFSKLDSRALSSYDYIKNREIWDGMKQKEQVANPIGMGSLYEMLKKIDKVAVAEIQKEIKAIHTANISVDNNVRFAKDDDEAALMLLPDVKDILILSNHGRIFYKKKYIWIYDKNMIDDHMLNFILTSKIYKTNNDSKLISFAQNVKTAKTIRDAIYVKIKTQDDVVDIYQKFHSTTKGRICFKDGVLDFKKKTFYTWDKIDFEYYTTEMINYDYAEYFNNPDIEIISKIKADIYDNLFGNKTTRALNFLSRAVAGHFEDKNWATYLGNRDCGKGVFYDNIKNAFGSYVKSFELGNIMYERSTDTQEVSRKMYWLLDYEFARLGISQETPPPGSNLKTSGKMLKKLGGGGDEHIARRNFDRVDTHFTIDTTLMFFGNSQIEVDIKDTMEHCIQFSSVNQFKSQDEINKMKAEGASDLLCASYKIKDVNIKSMCATEAWKKATVYLMYQYYVEAALSNDIDITDADDTEKTLRQTILETFEITGTVDDYLLCVDVIATVGDCKKKINNELVSMGVTKSKSKQRDSTRDKICYFGLKLKKDELVEN